MAIHDMTSRLDLYRFIHKALRACMSDALVSVGRMDPDDAAEVEQVLGKVRTLLNFCRGHLEHENHHVHPALELREPGSSRRIALEHVAHMQEIDDLRSAVLAVERTTGKARQHACARLYRALALFVGENFVHMETEEAEHNAALWRTHSDDELLAIEHRIVGSLSPEEAEISFRWMIPALSPAERVAFLSAIKAAAPAPVFQGILAGIRPHLGDLDWRKLSGALLSPVAA